MTDPSAIAARLPNGFHDAVLLAFHVDLAHQVVTLRLDFSVGDPEAPDESGREARRRGAVRLGGVTAMKVEPPSAGYRFSTGEGVLVDGDFGTYPGDPPAPADGLVRLWLFVQTWNSRMTFTAASCALSWDQEAA